LIERGRRLGLGGRRRNLSALGLLGSCLLRRFLSVEALSQCIDLCFERLDLGVARIGSMPVRGVVPRLRVGGH